MRTAISYLATLLLGAGTAVSDPCVTATYTPIDTGYTFHKLRPDNLDSVIDPTFTSSPHEYFVGSAALSTTGVVYVGNDNHNFYALSTSSLSQVSSYESLGRICSSPAIAYNVDEAHNRWLYVVTRGDNGKLLAFKTLR